MFRLVSLVAALAASLSSAASPEGPAQLEYRLIGPNVGGRVTRVSGVAGDPYTWYLAAAQGGVWKSVDGGSSFEPIFDKMPTQSIGSLTVAPSDPNVIYVGGGEANIRGNVQSGIGLFVSTDAGKTWTHSLKLHGAIGEIAVHPTRPNIAYAAVLGSAFAPGVERGVYRTRNTGRTWKRVLSVDADTGASDINIDTNNPRLLWAGTWQARRTPWGLTSGGPGSGLWHSRDGGDSWTRMTADKAGLPAGEWGKVGVAVSPADSSRVYALIEAKDGGLFRSDDGGDSFSLVNDHGSLRQRAWYYTTIEPDPLDPDTVWFPQVRMLRTQDGGTTLTSIDGFAHGDHHDLWIDPTDTTRLMAGHDGGIDISVDGGSRWQSPSLPLGQFYNIDVDQRRPYHVGGTLQDMGTVSGPSMSLIGSTGSLAEWRYVGGGEAGDFRYDLDKPGTIYASEYGGYLTRYQEGSGQYRNISAVPANPSGVPPKEMPQRFQWSSPIELSPHDPATLYHGANKIYRSRDRGENWQVISPDLTRDDKTKQAWSGGPITGDNTGVEIYGTVFSIDESPLTRGEIYAGSDDGRIHVSRDDGISWTDISPRGLPVDATVESLRASRHVKGRVYAVAHRYRLGDDKPYVFASEDHGTSWRSLAATLPAQMPFFSVAEDEFDAQTLYLGGESALFASLDAGRNWQSIQLNLPHVAVVDLETAQGDLVIGTRGRGLWTMHDLTALKFQLSRPAIDQPWLGAAASSIRWREESTWAKADGTENTAVGAQLNYYLPKAIGPDEVLELEILDAKGHRVRRLSSVPKPPDAPVGDADGPNEAPEAELSTVQGWNRAHWDLRHEGAELLSNAKIDSGNPAEGPLAIPGDYTVRMRLSSGGLETRIRVDADPRSPASAQDMAEQLAFALQMRAALNRIQSSVEWLRSAREQSQQLAARLRQDSSATAIVDAAEEVVADADRIEGALHNPEARVVYDILRGPKGAQLYSQLAPLYSWSQTSDLAPTAAMRARFAELSAQLAEREAAIAAMRTGSVAQLESAVAQAKLPRLILPSSG